MKQLRPGTAVNREDMYDLGRAAGVKAARQELTSTYNFGLADTRDTARGFIKQAQMVPGTMKYSASSLGG